MVDPTDITEPTGVTGEVVASETDMGDENSQAAASREAIDQLLPHLVEGPLRDEMVLLRGA